MQVKVFFKAAGGITDDLQLLLDQLTEQSIEYVLFNVEEKMNAESAEVYDVVNFPAVVVARDDGAPVQTWQHSLPQASDISNSLGRI
jgi:hypothetical protein